MPMDQLLKEMKQPRLFRAGLYSSRSQKAFSKESNTADLLFYLSDTDKQSLPKIEAIYNQRLFSSARISFLLEQLIQILKNAAIDCHQSAGKIDLKTDTQSKLLPDPKQNLHW